MFDSWVDRIIYARKEDELASRAAADEVYAYFRQLLNKRRGEPGGEDIISGMLSSEIDGRALSDDELLDICFLLFVAGLETSAWAIRSSLWYLATEPTDRRRLAENPSLIPNAAEEFLRTLSPVQAMARTLTQDTEVRGVTMRAVNASPSSWVLETATMRYSTIQMPYASTRTRTPLRLRRRRAPMPRSHLGRSELIVGLEEFLIAVPDFELAEPAPWHGVGPLMLRQKA